MTSPIRLIDPDRDHSTARAARHRRLVGDVIEQQGPSSPDGATAPSEQVAVQTGGALEAGAQTRAETKPELTLLRAYLRELANR